MKCWDIGGQEQYRSEWSRYTKGCDVVLYVVDAAAPHKLPTAKRELHKLLDDGSIGTTPMLVLANKIDIPEHVGESELIEKLQLNYVMETPWMVLPISALQVTNIDQVVEWLTAQGKWNVKGGGKAAERIIIFWVMFVVVVPTKPTVTYRRKDQTHTQSIVQQFMFLSLQG